MLAPVLTLRAAGEPGRQATQTSAVLLADVVELLDAAPDLLAFGAVPRRRAALAALDAGWPRCAAGPPAPPASGWRPACSASAGRSSRAPRSGWPRCGPGHSPGPALAVLALTPLATAELVAALPDAARRWSISRPAADRLAELDQLVPPVAEPVSPRPLPRRFRARRDALAVRWPGAEAGRGQRRRLPGARPAACSC